MADGRAFKIEQGNIRRIEAMFQKAPFGTPSGWSTYEQAMSEDIQDVRLASHGKLQKGFSQCSHCEDCTHGPG